MIHLLSFVLACSPLLVQDGERRVPAVELRASADDATPGTELRLYDVAHLTGQNRFDELVSGLKRDGDLPASPDVRERLGWVQPLRDEVESTTESLSRAIRDMLAPPFDATVDSITHLQGGTLAVVASLEQHAWLRAFLERVSSFHGMVDIQARILVFGKGKLAELGRQRSGEVLSESLVNALLQELKSLAAEDVQAPRVLVYPFQRAELSALDQVSYVQDYELKVLHEVEIADPVVGVAESGIRLSVRCVPLANGGLSIDSDLDYSTLTEPISTFETTLAGTTRHTVTIQLPEITRVSLKGSFEMRPGETLVMASTDATAKQEVLVLVRATRVEAQPEPQRD